MLETDTISSLPVEKWFTVDQPPGEYDGKVKLSLMPFFENISLSLFDHDLEELINFLEVNARTSGLYVRLEYTPSKHGNEVVLDISADQGAYPQALEVFGEVIGYLPSPFRADAEKKLQVLEEWNPGEMEIFDVVADFRAKIFELLEITSTEEINALLALNHAAMQPFREEYQILPEEIFVDSKDKLNQLHMLKFCLDVLEMAARLLGEMTMDENLPQGRGKRPELAKLLVYARIGSLIARTHRQSIHIPAISDKPNDYSIETHMQYLKSGITERITPDYLIENFAALVLLQGPEALKTAGRTVWTSDTQINSEKFWKAAIGLLERPEVLIEQLDEKFFKQLLSAFQNRISAMDRFVKEYEQQLNNVPS